MNLFYNKEAVGDVAFLQVEPASGEFNYEYKGDVVEIKNESQVVGYNIFNVSEKSTISGNGHVKLTETLVNEFQKAIEDAGFTFKL
ncbi:MAG: DUF4479 family protein, partial [Staphylococcus equorum]